jgi:AraC family transcriptional regulator
MYQEPEIKTIQPKTLIGKKTRMSMANNQTQTLWQSFMPHLRSIKHIVSSGLYAMQIYDQVFTIETINPQTEFEHWAAIEVSYVEDLPDNFSTHLLEGGKYAVFIHKGLPQDFPKTLQYIFQQWLPQSEFQLDHREHFQLMGEKYKNNDPTSEEEVWVPIILKS